MRSDLIDDGVTMASELAANTLHAGAEAGPAALGAGPGAPELWLYLRRAQGRQWELACKLFDSLAGWKDGIPPRLGDADPDAVTGRGLQVVAGLSAGRWGHHLSRSRLGGRKVAGKAVWFALPVPAPANAPDWAWRAGLSAAGAARALALMLADRGLGERLMLSDEPAAGLAMLSVQCGLTVWCRDGTISWRTRAGSYQRQAVTDLVESAEQIVATSEEIGRGAGAGYPGLDRVRPPSGRPAPGGPQA